MNTTNIVSTPNIEGNIGSCEVKTIQNTTGNQIWRTETTVIFTNSCSGEIIKENVYYNYFPLLPISLVIILFISVVSGAIIEMYKE